MATRRTNEQIVRLRIAELQKLYASIAEKLKKSLLDAELSDFKRFRQRELLAQVTAAQAALSDASRNVAKQVIPLSYQQGSDIAERGMSRMRMAITPNLGNKLHSGAVQVLTDQMVVDLLGGASAQTQFMRTYIKRTQQALLTERAIQTRVASGIAEGATRREVSDSILRALRARLPEGQFVRINGRNYRPDYYARLVARTMTREAVTQGAVNTGVEAGIDLFQVSVHEGACDICLPFQGRVFSVSGADGDFPALDELPPYHPHCRHVVVPVTKGHLERLGQLDAVKKLNDRKIEIGGDAEFRKFLRENQG